jgi:hypothetical protein
MSVSRTIFVHELCNPPYSGHGVEVELNFTNGKHFEITNWKKSDQPSFTLTIKDPKSIGLINTDAYNIEKFIDNVTLSFNLVLKDASFSRNKADSSDTELKHPNEVTEREDQNGNKQVNIAINNLRVTMHATIGFKEDIDEEQILQILEKLIKLDSLSSVLGLKIQDLKKSLDDYSNAMSNFNRLDIFKNLNSSIEHSVNCDGFDRKGSNFDNEVGRITGIDLLKFADWRELNARAKHID